jgi:hypothetical protein
MAEPPWTFNTIVAAVDFSEASGEVVQAALASCAAATAMSP